MNKPSPHQQGYYRNDGYPHPEFCPSPVSSELMNVGLLIHQEVTEARGASIKKEWGAEQRVPSTVASPGGSNSSIVTSPRPIKQECGEDKTTYVSNRSLLEAREAPTRIKKEPGVEQSVPSTVTSSGGSNSSVITSPHPIKRKCDEDKIMSPTKKTRPSCKSSPATPLRRSARIAQK